MYKHPSEYTPAPSCYQRDTMRYGQEANNTRNARMYRVSREDDTAENGQHIARTQLLRWLKSHSSH